MTRTNSNSSVNGLGMEVGLFVSLLLSQLLFQCVPGSDLGRFTTIVFDSQVQVVYPEIVTPLNKNTSWHGIENTIDNMFFNRYFPENKIDTFFLGMIEMLPVCIFKPDPVYPEKAQLAGIEGLVVLWVYLDELGTVKKVKVYLSSEFPSLDEAAISAAFESRWTAAQQNGISVGVWTTLPYDFSLSN